MASPDHEPMEPDATAESKHNMEIDTHPLVDQSHGIDRRDAVRPTQKNFFLSRDAFENYSMDRFSLIAGSFVPAEDPPVTAISPPADRDPSSPTGDPSPPAIQKPAQPLLNTLLASMSSTSRSSTKAPDASAHLSDLDVAMQAAVSSIKSSRFKWRDHTRFKTIGENMQNPDCLVVPADKKFYTKMLASLRSEKDEFIKDQKDTMLASGIYDTLHDAVNTLFNAYIDVEQHRPWTYPARFQQARRIPLKDLPSSKKVILSFKKTLSRQGMCAPLDIPTTPSAIDMTKHYLQPSIPSTPVSYYQKKIPPSLSIDSVVESAVLQSPVQIVATVESLLPLVTLPSSLATGFYIPLRVMQHENQPSNTLYFDTPLPINRSWSARERNQLYFNMACKSQLLDWPRASRFDPPTKQPAENTDLVASNDPDSENLVYNYWTFGDMTLLLRHQIDGYLESNNEKRYCLVSAKLDYQLDHDREEISTAQERSNHWLRSFLAGHATLLEARVDVPNNRITRVDQKQMRDIMGDKWQPLQESELLRFLFTELHRDLEPGQYILEHKPGQQLITIHKEAAEDTIESDISLDLHSLGTTTLADADDAFIPAWQTKSTAYQVPWTFPPK